ncbi:head GIN domain-containing protein [Chloroflexota bacterium]
MNVIKTTIIVLLATALLIIPLGCWNWITGSGNITTEVKDFNGFTKVEAHNGFQLEVIQSSSFSIEIIADDNLHEHIKVVKLGDTLKIELDGISGCNSCTLEAKITMPDLYKLDLSGGSRADISGFSLSHDFSVGLSGGSRLEGDITFVNADFNLSGGSRINLEGSGDDVNVDGSGGSHLDLEFLLIENADIKLSGGGRGDINVSGTLSVDLSGGSQLTYVGQPTLGDIDLSGGSTIGSK